VVAFFSSFSSSFDCFPSQALMIQHTNSSFCNNARWPVAGGPLVFQLSARKCIPESPMVSLL
jgi:hypothetical protein